jgi:hypothetical protein
MPTFERLTLRHLRVIAFCPYESAWQGPMWS